MRNRAAILALIFAVVLTTFANAQSPKVENPGFETGSPGSSPPGWFVPQPVVDAGYTVQISSDGPQEGKQCVAVRLAGSPGQGFGNVMQVIDATPYRGKRVRFRAAVRYLAGNGFGQAALWLRVDRKGGEQGFFDNMGGRPIRKADWDFYEINGDIDADAEFINIGMMLVGSGQACLDAVTLGLSDGKSVAPAGAKPLTDRGLENLVAFAKLYGYVRHFHPSDAVERADWGLVAMAGVLAAEPATGPDDLAQKLEAFFRPLAPTVRVFATGKGPQRLTGLDAPADKSGLQTVSWENIGFGGGTIAAEQNIYHSKRVFASAAGVNATYPGGREPFEADLGGGVSCLVPLTLYAKDGRALPMTAPPTKPEGLPDPPTGNDRTTRLADIVIGWNVFQHFYPYFDVVKADWPRALRDGLSLAATDPDERTFLDTLKRMVATAHDGHGFVGLATAMAFAQPPLVANWVEGKLVVVQVANGTTKPRIGDEILKIGGKTVTELWAKREALISGATEQWRRRRAQTDLLAGTEGSTVDLELRRGDGSPYSVTLTRSLTPVPESRPKPIEEVKPGIWYVDLDQSRAKMDDFQKALPDLLKAKGLVFDMRGYPNEVAMEVLKRISDKPVTSALWNVPRYKAPDQQDVEFVKSRWPEMGPTDPRFVGKIAFLTDGRAISFAESVMGIVEAYKLGEIVGSTTAGTNGNVNPFALPGGYTVVFTGMKVLKHDGTQHHGIGIKPTVPVERTVQGVMEKRDEVLEKGIAVVGG